jgi:hypothetical protein
MDPILTTPRLKLTLLNHAAKGSEEFAWLHELRSDKQAQHWRYAITISCFHLYTPTLTQPPLHPIEDPRAQRNNTACI